MTRGRRGKGKTMPVSTELQVDRTEESVHEEEIPVEKGELETSFQEITLGDSGKVMLSTGSSEEPPVMSPDLEEPTDLLEDQRSPKARMMVPLSEYVGTKDLLLHLLQSDYFDAWIGLNYLWRYNGKDVGMQWFLCERLRERSLDEIEFVLPQICHLVIFNPVESTPLECFLLDVCHQSLHASIFTLWFLENYLVDLREALGTKEGAVKFDRCCRILQEAQLAIWGDVIKPVRLRKASKEHAHGLDELGEEPSDARLGLDTLPSVEATLVGFGCALASFGSPLAGQSMRPLVLMEARKRDRFRQARFKPIRTLSTLGSKSDLAAAQTMGLTQQQHNHPVLVPMTTSFPSIEDLSQGRAFSLKDAITKTAKQIAKSSAAAMVHPAHPPKEEWMPPLYYHPEMQFVMGLIDISRRLCHVPGREGRQQALQAELSLFNHNIPASICIPLWCHGTDSVKKPACRSPVEHHRILRIPPSESVILNSAERVPFVIYVEVVKDMSDVDFGRVMKLARNTCPDDEHVEHNTVARDRSYSQPTGPQIKTPPLRSYSTDKLPAAQEEKHPMSPSTTMPTLLDQPVDQEGFAERMRTAAIMLAQLTRQATAPSCPATKLADINAIKAKLIAEMEALEKSRLLDALQQRDSTEAEGPLYAVGDPRGGPVIVKDDPSAAVFREGFEEKKQRIRDASPYGHLSGWDLLSVIVKSGADMRQEQLACQLIEEMHDIWNMAGLPIWVYPFRILVAAAEGGLVETVRNALSIHSIRKNVLSTRATLNEPYSLRDHYIRTFGSPDSDSFINARDAFMKSLAGYSLVTYILQLKDRHNGNILIDAHGHMIHIDFGFMLANFPGGYYGFESAPFKLSSEYIDLLGGLHSEAFAIFKDLMFQGFMALRKHADRLLLLLEITQKDSRLPCFGSSGPNAIAQLRQRFQLGLTESQVHLFVDRMITGSAYNVFTRLYDSFQYYSNGIL